MQERLIKIISPEYRANIYGDTEIEFYCHDAERVELYSQKPPHDLNISSNGAKELIAAVKLDNYSGSAVFHAEDFPNGPILIKLSAYGSNGEHIDDCYLQLYNRNGVAWKTNLANAPVNPVTHGMKITFEDDFSDSELSVTRQGLNGVKYASAKPDVWEGGEFGYSFFASKESQYNPFELVDGTYLRITTKYLSDYNDTGGWGRKSSTGFISSIGVDGSGFHTKSGRQYFEARLLLGPNPGGWPAFWTLTSNNYAARISEFKGEPCDELDILEGYMAWPYHYAINCHPWGEKNPARELGREKHLGHWANVDNQNFNFINLNMGFHIFAVLITEETTHYYCDNIEVWSHPTLPLSYELGNFFMINGGTSDHDEAKMDNPSGFRRYGDECHMYIDWVRVWES